MIKTILIDLDDTLWDTQTNNKESLEELYSLFNWGRVYSSFEAFFSIYEPNNERQWALYRQGLISKQELTLGRFAPVLAPLGITAEEEILDINTHFLITTSRKTKLIPGALPLLRYLKSLYRVVVISNGFREVQYTKISKSGLSPYIDHIILSEDAKCNKPHKPIFDYAFSRTNTRPSETIMIGDSWDADIIGAQNAGIRSIWFNPKVAPLPEHPLRRPVYVASALSEIPPILTSLLPF